MLPALTSKPPLFQVHGRPRVNLPAIQGGSVTGPPQCMQAEMMCVTSGLNHGHELSKQALLSLRPQATFTAGRASVSLSDHVQKISPAHLQTCVRATP